MNTPEPSQPIHVLAMQLREALDDMLPEGIGVTINASEGARGTGTVNLTISSWPQEMHMLNYQRVVAERIAVVEGRKYEGPKLAYLSHEGQYFATLLQALLDEYFPSVTDGANRMPEWLVSGEVVFDSHALERERIEIIHSLKSTKGSAPYDK